MFSIFKNLFNIKAENTFKVADDIKNQVAENINVNSAQNQLNQYNFGISYSEVREIIAVENNLANQRLIEKIEPRLLPEDKEKIKNDYDFLHTYNDAVKISAKKQNKEIDDILSELIIDRINSNNEIEKIVSNEAIKTIEKLTNNQLKIITLAFLIRYVNHARIIDNKSFDSVITEKISPFIDFEEKITDFEHIEYTNCGHISAIRVDFEQILTNNYQSLDINNLSEQILFVKKTWSTSTINRLKLTSVGLLIAIKYYKIITQNELNTKIWIN